MAYEFKRLGDVDIIESINDGLNVLVEDGGAIVKIAANNLVPEDVVTQGEMETALNNISDRIPEQTKADLSETDESSAAYVNGVLQPRHLPEGYPYAEEMPPALDVVVSIDGTQGTISGADGYNLMQLIDDGSKYIVCFDDLQCVMTGSTFSMYDVYDMNYTSGDAPVSSISIGNIDWGNNTANAILTTNSDQTGSHNVKIYHEDQMIQYHTLDENYIPDTIARAEDIPSIPEPTWEALPDKPFYYNEIEYVRIQEQTFTDNAIWSRFWGLNLAEGRTYRVIFDGVTYDCVAYRDVNMGGEVCIGNAKINNASWESKDETAPFFAYSSTGSGTDLRAASTGEHTIKVIELTIELKTIDEMFIPNTIARTADIPKAAAVADAAGEAPTAAEFNALLTALRNAGLLATE